MHYIEYIEENTIRLEASRRGGGIEIDASEALGLEDAKMTAYQNYLGGGMLGSIQNSFNFDTSELSKDKQNTARELAEALTLYFHNITNEEAGAYDDWAAGSLEDIQARAGSAY